MGFGIDPLGLQMNIKRDVGAIAKTKIKKCCVYKFEMISFEDIVILNRSMKQYVILYQLITSDYIKYEVV